MNFPRISCHCGQTTMNNGILRDEWMKKKKKKILYRFFFHSFDQWKIISAAPFWIVLLFFVSILFIQNNDHFHRINFLLCRNTMIQTKTKHSRTYSIKYFRLFKQRKKRNNDRSLCLDKMKWSNVMENHINFHKTYNCR